LPSAGDVVVIDFPGVQGIKRRPAVVLSSAAYHTSRPDVVVGLITSRAVAAGPTDHRGLSQFSRRGKSVIANSRIRRENGTVPLVPYESRRYFGVSLPPCLLPRILRLWGDCQIAIGRACRHA